MTSLVTTEANLRKALERSSVLQTRLKRAERRTAELEAVLIEVWKWSNDDDRELGKLITLLRSADRQDAVIVALEELERSRA